MGQYSFLGLMIFSVTRLIPLTMGKQSVAWNEHCVEAWYKEPRKEWIDALAKLQESMDRCTGHHSVTEVMLKTALITYNQSICNNAKNIFKKLSRVVTHRETQTRQ